MHVHIVFKATNLHSVTHVTTKTCFWENCCLFIFYFVLYLWTNKKYYIMFFMIALIEQCFNIYVTFINYFLIIFFIQYYLLLYLTIYLLCIYLFIWLYIFIFIYYNTYIFDLFNLWNFSSDYNLKIILYLI